MNLQRIKILRTFAKIILLFVGVFLIGYIASTFYTGVRNKPYKVRITNITDSAFTVSWITDTPMSGVVYYSDKDDFLPGVLSWIGKKKAFDDRDVSLAQTDCVSNFNKRVSKHMGEDFTVDASGYDCNNVRVVKRGRYYTHHITVPHLDSDKEYFFRVGNGLFSFKSSEEEGVDYIEREMPSIADFKQRTLSTFKDVSSPKPAYGTSYNVYYKEDGTMGERNNFDSLIFLKTFKDDKEYPLMSAVSNSDGGWSIDLSNIRDEENKSVEIEGALLEFVPQVENTQPGSAGKSLFDELKFPLRLMGNSEGDWERANEMLDSSVKGAFINKFMEQALAVRHCYKCENGVLKTNTDADWKRCPAGYSTIKPQCPPTTSPPATKTCCKILGGSCSCAELSSCGGSYPYEGLEACKEVIEKVAPIQYVDKDWGERCINTNSKCKCPDGSVIEIGSSCSIPSIGWGQECTSSNCKCPDSKVIMPGLRCSEQPIERCSDLENMLIGPTAVRGGCQNGNNYCYIPYYHKNPNGSQGELCQYVKTVGAACGSVYCGDEEVLEIGFDNWTGTGKNKCKNGAGCRCKDGSVTQLNNTCEGREEKVKCYMYSNAKGCYLSFEGDLNNCRAQGGLVGEKECKENYVCTKDGGAELGDFVTMCIYKDGCGCPKGAKKSGVACGEKCVREVTCGNDWGTYRFNKSNNECENVPDVCKIEDCTGWCYSEAKCKSMHTENEYVCPCVIFNGDKCVENSNCNDCKTLRVSDYYYFSMDACMKNRNVGQCYDAKNYASVPCNTCTQGNCIMGNDSLEEEFATKERKGYVLVPLDFNGSVSQVYIWERTYQGWLNHCIETGNSTSITYATVSSPSSFVTGTPECPKVEFNYLPGKEFGHMAIYNYKTLDSIWNALGLSSVSDALTRLVLTDADATVPQALAAMGVGAVGSSSVAMATELVAAEFAAANNIVIKESLYNGIVARVAKVLATEGLEAAKAQAFRAAQTCLANNLAIGTAGGSATLATTGGVATSGATASSVAGGSTTIVAAGGGMGGGAAGGTAITTTGGAAAGGAGGVSAATVAGGVVVVVAVGLTVEALTHLEYTYEQCATVVDGVITYRIQPRYCERTRTGVKWESTLCECNGTRTELKKSTSPVLDINYYIKNDFSFEACAGSDCNDSIGVKINPKSKDVITVGGRSLICCAKDNKPKTPDECSPTGLVWDHSTIWGKCVNVDTVSILGLLFPSFDNQEIANWNDDEEGALIKKVGASEEEQTQQILSHESGLYKVSLIGGSETYLLKEGDIALSYYIERNGIIGYQSPENPFQPGPHEDLAVTESSVIISVSKEATVYEKELKKGINIVSFDFLPVNNSEKPELDSVDFLNLVNTNGNNISRISYFSGGKWDGGTMYDFEKRETKGAPFILTTGVGYVIVAEKDTKILIPGYNVESSIPIAFSSGWNLVGIHGQPTQYTAKSLINSINTVEGLTANNVSWWPTDRGMYQGYQLLEGQEYGQDFPISKDLGYFIRVSDVKEGCRSVWWNPGGEDNGKCSK